MATVSPTFTQLGADVMKAVWVLTTADADGAPLGKHFADYADRTVSVDGDFGSGSVAIQGSADGSSWAALSDHTGTPIAMAADSSVVISEIPLKTRPALTGSTGATVNVTMVLRRERSAYS